MKKPGIRKLLLEVDEETLDFMNDYKYAVLMNQGIVINNSEVLAEAVRYLKKVSAQPGAMQVNPRPDGVRQAETIRREVLQAGRDQKRRNQQED